MYCTLAVLSCVMAGAPRYDLVNTCGDGVCKSPEFEGSCPLDCGQIVRNPRFIRDSFGRVRFWSVRPDHLATEMVFDGAHNATVLVPGMVLNQERLRLVPSTSYSVSLSSSDPLCVDVFLHTETRVLLAASNVTTVAWDSPANDEEVAITLRSNCNLTISQVSFKPIPMTSNLGWKYYDIVDSILTAPVRLSPGDCRQRCLDDTRCCAWQVCAGTDAEGCGGCYLLGRKPDESSADFKDGWFAAIERSVPESSSNLSVDSCRRWLLTQSAHEKDFYDTASGKLQKYVNCATIVREDKTVPKQIFVGGVHLPTIVVANHRSPDPRLNGGPNILPHFYVVPFYDTNIGNVIKHTSSMNILQSHEMQSILSPGEVFVDVGANLGSYTVPLAEHLGPSGIVIAVEPFRWLSQLLNANVAINGLMNCWTFQIALGDVPNRVDLLQPNLRHFSSPGGVRVNHQSNVTEDTRKQLYDLEWGTEAVDTWTLDDVVFGGTVFSSRNRNPQVDLIKIDVEGMEGNVIRGAVRVLKELKPIVWVENVDFFDHKNTDFLRLMESVEYSCWKSLHAGNDLVCEPVSGERSVRLAKVGKETLVWK